MSAKNRRQAAKAHDIYPTPVRLVRAGFDVLFQRHGEVLQHARRFLEPGAGFGPFCRMASLYLPAGASITGVETHPPAKRYPYTLVKQDFLRWKPARRPFDLIATNPPFTLAEEFIRRSQQLLGQTGLMFYLMRMGVTGSKQRRALWHEVNLREVWLIRPRPSFQKDGGSDATEYAFFLMDGQTENCSEDVHFRWLDWDLEDERALVLSDDDVAIRDFGYPD